MKKLVSIVLSLTMSAGIYGVVGTMGVNTIKSGVELNQELWSQIDVSDLNKTLEM